jgi:hypothetical protein
MILFCSAVLGMEPAAPIIEIAGPDESVFAWRDMRCDTWDIPDAPGRAWRDAEGNVHLLASHLINRAMVGRDLDHVRHDCHTIYRGGERDAPELYDDRSWIASPYTTDGRTVFALVHNEFQGHLRPSLCASGTYPDCWRNSLTLITSQDGGLSFSHAVPPQQLVASPPYRYSGELGRRSGYFNPSNIVFRDGFYYAFFWAEAEGAQRRGACLMRTATLADPAAWRGWDGHEFAVAFVDPYRFAPGEAARHVCAPVAEGRLSSFIASLTRLRASGLYLALVATERPARPGGSPVTGIFAAVSADLLHWSEPSLIRETGVLFKFDCASGDPLFYPVLLDPTTTSRNFEDSAERAFLYFTRLHLDHCRLGPDRDLVRVPVVIRTAALNEALR